MTGSWSSGEDGVEEGRRAGLHSWPKMLTSKSGTHPEVPALAEGRRAGLQSWPKKLTSKSGMDPEVPAIVV